MLESIFPMTELLKIRAVDVDAEADFGSVRYAVRGEGEDTFVVDPVEGNLMVSETLNLKSLSQNQRPFMKYEAIWTGGNLLYKQIYLIAKPT